MLTAAAELGVLFSGEEGAGGAPHPHPRWLHPLDWPCNFRVAWPLQGAECKEASPGLKRQFLLGPLAPHSLRGLGVL